MPLDGTKPFQNLLQVVFFCTFLELSFCSFFGSIKSDIFPFSDKGVKCRLQSEFRWVSMTRSIDTQALVYLQFLWILDKALRTTLSLCVVPWACKGRGYGSSRVSCVSCVRKPFIECFGKLRTPSVHIVAYHCHLFYFWTYAACVNILYCTYHLLDYPGRELWVYLP